MNEPNTKMQSAIMEDYRRAVEYYASRGENNLLHNEGDEHALIIFENIFRNAKSHIRIAARDLSNKQVANTDTYIKALNVFLNNRNAKLDILLVNFNEQCVNAINENNLFLSLSKTDAYKDNRVCIKNSGGRFFTVDSKEVHFCTADGRMYRFEDDVEYRKARCNFGDEDTTKFLENVFDETFIKIENQIRLENYIQIEA